MRIAHFSAGASSAVAAIIGRADKLVYAETGSEHGDNQRFIADVEAYLGKTVSRFHSDKYADTWDVWKRRRFLANRYGAPCTKALKLLPLAPVEQIPGAIHLFGYTVDETERFRRLQALKPDMLIECPLIDAGLRSSDALGFLERIGIKPPVTYAMGLPHANCIPCPKATSPGYWALIRDQFPQEFARMADLEVELSNGKTQGMARVKGKRMLLRDLPNDIKPRGSDQPGCDLLCEIARSRV